MKLTYYRLIRLKYLIAFILKFKANQTVNRVASLPRNLEKPGICHFRQKNLEKPEISETLNKKP